MRLARAALRATGSVVLAAAAGWAALALWIDGPRAASLRLALVVGFAAACGAALVRLRSARQAALAIAALVGLVAAWWLSIPPSNDRDWLPDVARLAGARIDGDVLTVENVRAFSYASETEFVPRWETRRYDLSKLRAVDLFTSQWSSPFIVHTIMSWVFEDGPPLAISIETRKERGETYSALLGFFRHFELVYVVADERDVIGLRARHRNETVRLYRLRASPEVARALLLDYLAAVESLREEPAWYHAATQNCTTTIRHHVQAIAPRSPWSWKILVNGFLDRLAYERGTIDTSLPFEELRARSDVTARARAAADALDFSARIREGLPGMDAPGAPATEAIPSRGLTGSSGTRSRAEAGHRREGTRPETRESFRVPGSQRPGISASPIRPHRVQPTASSQLRELDTGGGSRGALAPPAQPMNQRPEEAGSIPERSAPPRSAMCLRTFSST